MSSKRNIKMKILYVSLDTKFKEYNAQHIHTFSLARYLSKYNKLFLIIGGNLYKITKIFNLKVLITKYDPPIFENSFLKIIKLIYNHFNLFFWIKHIWQGYDVVYERCRIGMLIGIVLSKFFRVPLVYELNGILDEEMYEAINFDNEFLKKIVSILFSIQLKNAHVIIVQTIELKHIIEKRLGTNNIFVVENGVNHISLPLKKNTNKIIKLVFVGNLDRSHDLKDVFNSIVRTKDKFKFFIVGGGDLKENYVKQYSHDKRFIFVGNLPHRQALKYIIDSNICIASYTRESLIFKKYGFYFCPLKLLEYSAAGKPTIMYGLSNSFTKIFEIGNACIVINTKEEFVNKLRGLIFDPKLMQKMGSDAREMANKFTWERTAKKTEDILKYAINTN